MITALLTPYLSMKNYFYLVFYAQKGSFSCKIHFDYSNFIIFATKILTNGK